MKIRAARSDPIRRIEPKRKWCLPGAVVMLVSPLCRAMRARGRAIQRVSASNARVTRSCLSCTDNISTRSLFRQIAALWLHDLGCLRVELEIGDETFVTLDRVFVVAAEILFLDQQQVGVAGL